MLLPDKHISFAESLIGLGSFVLESLKSPKTIDILWRNFESVRGQEYPAFHSFDNLVLAVDALFALGAIDLTDDGELKRSPITETT
ncbi:MAG: ABC-three component system middle component 6 [Pseudomonadota bacterium]